MIQINNFEHEFKTVLLPTCVTLAVCMCIVYVSMDLGLGAIISYQYCFNIYVDIGFRHL